MKEEALAPEGRKTLILVSKALGANTTKGISNSILIDFCLHKLRLPPKKSARESMVGIEGWWREHSAKILGANPVRYTSKKKNPRRRAYKAKTEGFYKSWEWRKVRMEVLQEQGRKCRCCGAEPGQKDMNGNPVKITVDHIKPLAKFWDLRLQKSNLQILCDECNQGKGAWSHKDFREEAQN